MGKWIKACTVDQVPKGSLFSVQLVGDAKEQTAAAHDDTADIDTTTTTSTNDNHNSHNNNNNNNNLSSSQQTKKILLANLDDTIYATDLICTHADADLSLGFLSPEGVRCPLHLSVFNLHDGKPQNPPAQNPLKTYNIKIEQNTIYVEV